MAAIRSTAFAKRSSGELPSWITPSSSNVRSPRLNATTTVRYCSRSRNRTPIYETPGPQLALNSLRTFTAMRPRIHCLDLLN